MDWPATVIDVSEEGLDALIEEGVPVLLVFWAPWSDPSRRLLRYLPKLALEVEGSAIIARLNIDLNLDVIDRFQLRALATVIAFRGGKLVGRNDGTESQAVVEHLLELCL